MLAQLLRPLPWVLALLAVGCVAPADVRDAVAASIGHLEAAVEETAEAQELHAQALRDLLAAPDPASRLDALERLEHERGRESEALRQLIEGVGGELERLAEAAEQAGSPGTETAGAWLELLLVALLGMGGGAGAASLRRRNLARGNGSGNGSGEGS